MVLITLTLSLSSRQMRCKVSIGDLRPVGTAEPKDTTPTVVPMAWFSNNSNVRRLVVLWIESFPGSFAFTWAGKIRISDRDPTKWNATPAEVEQLARFIKMGFGIPDNDPTAVTTATHTTTFRSTPIFLHEELDREHEITDDESDQDLDMIAVNQVRAKRVRMDDGEDELVMVRTS
ncbi:hypothetical protein EDB80DRAFT_880173 [Ilyonectria destructans]|nr:hypothetical protein EDB80DRAFT_880173 [Ilyonectria destructans]